MTYSNPRLKHVKKIKEIASEVWIDGDAIIYYCNLLLETKKAKKRKCLHNDTKLVFERGGGYLGEFCKTCKKYVSRPDPKEESKEKCGVCGITLLKAWTNCPRCSIPDPKTTLKEIEEIKFDWDWSANLEPMVDKLNELIEGYNQLIKSK